MARGFIRTAAYHGAGQLKSGGSNNDLIPKLPTTHRKQRGSEKGIPDLPRINRRDSGDARTRNSKACTVGSSTEAGSRNPDNLRNSTFSAAKGQFQAKSRLPPKVPFHSESCRTSLGAFSI
jgi:hypothetical protein